MEVPQKPKTQTALLSNIHTSGYISRGDKNTTMKKYLHYHVHASIAHSSQDGDTTQRANNGGRRGKGSIHMCAHVHGRTRTHTHTNIIQP